MALDAELHNEDDDREHERAELRLAVGLRRAQDALGARVLEGVVVQVERGERRVGAEGVRDGLGARRADAVEGNVVLSKKASLWL